MKVLVVTVGAVLEWTGIVLIAWPEVLPRLRRLKAAAARGVHRAGRWVRSLWRRRGGSTGVRIGTAAERDMALPLTVVKTPPAGESLEQKVERLIALSVEMQTRIAEAERRIKAQPDAWRLDIAGSEGRMATLMDGKVEAVRDAHIRVRLWGIAFVLVGLPLLAWANFL